jgi:UTP--glucose-1-phosphate uridylyltransferase
MPIDRAVIPVAGLGTRLLPTTKAIPKEMLPAGRLPIIHHVVEELIQAGIRRILFISSRNKVAIENHFDDYSALLMHLELDGRDVREMGRFDYRQRGIEFFFTRQQVPLGQTKPLGTGDAVAAAESFVSGAPFVVAYGDSIITTDSGDNLLKRMIASHDEHRSSCTIGAWEVDASLVGNYGILVPRPGEKTTTHVLPTSSRNRSRAPSTVLAPSVPAMFSTQRYSTRSAPSPLPKRARST